MKDLLLLEQPQTVNCLKERVHDQWLLASEIIELHRQILNDSIHLLLIDFPVLLPL